ncbi:hypothetical protein GA0115243_1059153 [Streptomyces sp. ScaeMP-e83]|nr:hypothetical protein [Streptomyces sp. SID4937]SCE03702.1 hypothetical protein GA0115243_1059153 [Streptomyces sp. ScaeMP-e83]
MVRRWVPALVLGGLWWWAVLRLALHPEQAGVVEGAVAAGGWGLSLLPVHVASGLSGGVGRPEGLEGLEEGVAGAEQRSSRARSGRLVVGREQGASRGRLGWLAAVRGRLVAGVTRAWRRRRSGGGSGRS